MQLVFVPMRSSMIVVLWMTVMAGLACGVMTPIGGGFLDGGLLGSYYASTDMTGSPAFTRRDQRIRFPLGALRSIGGSTAPAMRNFPRDNFTVRWEGRIIARFNEIYTFSALADEGVRLYVKPAGDVWGAPLIDQWGATGLFTAACAMTAGVPYDIRLDYLELTGTAAIVLQWSSPSTPLELIDAVAPGGPLSFGLQDTGGGFADAVRDAQQWNALSGTYTADENGWPKCDASILTIGNLRGQPGRHLIQFKGQAQIAFTGGLGATATFYAANGTPYVGTFPKGLNYDASNNITRVEVDIREAAVQTKPQFSFSSTQRTPGSPNGSGITEVYVMRPWHAWSTNAHQPGDVVRRAARDALEAYAVFRVQFMDAATVWSNRTLPSFYKWTKQFVHNARCWESIVMYANESGRDVHVGFSPDMRDPYFTNLVNLLRYGSDGVNPYTSEQVNPVYPPLNPNIRIYLEMGNENGWGIWPSEAFASAFSHAKNNNTPDWQIVNYDGAYSSAGAVTIGFINRWVPVRMTKLSHLCRSVFGDEDFANMVRVCIFGQYSQSHQNSMLQFIDTYFNNGDGVARVPNALWPEQPRPVSYYVGAAGGAVYYTSRDRYGTNGPNAGWLENGSFETPALPAGTAALQPTNTGWTFTGNAGVCDVRTARRAAITNQSLGTLGNGLATATRMGFKFTVGPADIYVYEVGRWCASGNNGTHRMAIYRDDGSGTDLLSPGGNTLGVDLKGATPGRFHYRTVWGGRYSSFAESARIAPLRLQSNTTYYLVSYEANGGDQFYNEATTVAPVAGITILGAARTTDGITFTLAGGPNTSYGPVNMVFTDTPFVTAQGFVGVPPDEVSYESGMTNSANYVFVYPNYTGNQCAFLAGEAGVQRSVTFANAGKFSVLFRAAQAQPVQDVALNIFVDGICVWTNTVPSGARKNGRFFYDYSTDIFENPVPGMTRTIRFAGTGKNQYGSTRANSCIFLDKIMITSMDALFGGPDVTNYPYTGDAQGFSGGRFEQYCKAECEMAHQWGVLPVTYEGGESLAGDWNDGGMMHFTYARYVDDRMRIADMKAITTWTSFGGRYFSHYREPYPNNMADYVTNYPIWRSVKELSQSWTLEPTNGYWIPCTLTSALAHNTGSPSSWSPSWWITDTSPQLTPAKWKAWMVIAPASRHYTVLTTTAAGGQALVTANDATAISAGASGGTMTGVVYLAKGLHAIKIKSTTGTFNVTSIELLLPAQTNLAVYGGGQLIPDSSAQTSGANGTQFGDVVIGGDEIHVFVVTNIGATALSLTGVPAVAVLGAHAGDFAVVQQPAALLAPGTGAVFTLQFSPLAYGARSALVRIPHSASAPYEFAVSGTGIPEPYGLLALAVLALKRRSAA